VAGSLGLGSGVNPTAGRVNLDHELQALRRGHGFRGKLNFSRVFQVEAAHFFRAVFINLHQFHGPLDKFPLEDGVKGDQFGTVVAGVLQYPVIGMANRLGDCPLKFAKKCHCQSTATRLTPHGCC
jgi:hypothetical protein